MMRTLLTFITVCVYVIRNAQANAIPRQVVTSEPITKMNAANTPMLDKQNESKVASNANVPRLDKRFFGGGLYGGGLYGGGLYGGGLYGAYSPYSIGGNLGYGQWGGYGNGYNAATGFF